MLIKLLLYCATQEICYHLFPLDVNTENSTTASSLYARPKSSRPKPGATSPIKAARPPPIKRKTTTASSRQLPVPTSADDSDDDDVSAGFYSKVKVAPGVAGVKTGVAGAGVVASARGAARVTGVTSPPISGGVRSSGSTPRINRSRTTMPGSERNEAEAKRTKSNMSAIMSSGRLGESGVKPNSAACTIL